MAYNMADLFEHTADVIPDRIGLLCGDETRTFAELEARSNQLAHHLPATGIEPDDHVGIYAANSIEWIEALLAIFKIRAVPININYRYVEAELAYLFDNADLGRARLPRGVRPPRGRRHRRGPAAARTW